MDNLERKPSIVPVEKTRTKAKLVFLSKLVGFVIGKHGSFIKSLCDKYDVSIKFLEERDSRCISRNETICSIVGNLENV